MHKKHSYIVICSSVKRAANWFDRAAIAFVFFLLNSAAATAQAQQEQLLQNQFSSYQEDNLQEKIFIHTDKNNYVPGEICWFKIYNVDAYFNKPIDLGKCAYIEILDKNNKPVLQAKVALDKGFGDGSILLPATIVSGNYHFRAYTNWMKNFGAAYFFEKEISIINVQKGQPENDSSQKNIYTIAFFPEGGNLVYNIKSTVGFKFCNQFGRGVNGEGFLLNDGGDTITSFRALHAGMGNFSFTPVAGVKYRALVNFADSNHQLQSLPDAFNEGYVMHVERNGRQIIITVQTPAKNSSATAAIFLFVQTRNIVKAVKSTTIQNGLATFLLADTIPGEGISQFTIFNENRQPVCERLFFTQPKQTLQIDVSTDEQLYALRKKININVSSTSETGRPVAANMSMAVYRVDSFNTVDLENISSCLLLSSDLTGMVESPQYYFLENGEGVSEAADNLMLTQGWRRFKWGDILLNKKMVFKFLPEISGHVVNGNVTTTQPGLSLNNIRYYLSVSGVIPQFQTATTDVNGNIKFDVNNFYGGSDIILQTNEKPDSYRVDSLYRINVASPFFTGYSNKPLSSFDFKLQNKPLLKMYIASQVQNTFSFSKLHHASQAGLDTNSFYLKPDATYYLDNYVRFTTLEEVLREYVRNVNVMDRKNKFYLTVLDEKHKVFFSDPPLILFDGIPYFDFDKIVKYDPMKIRKLELVTREYYLGTNAFDGILNFTTYKGDAGGYEIDPRATVVDYEGLQLRRDFYSPSYAADKELHSRIPDFRNLLYWCPNLITKADGKQQEVFYSSDVPGRYAIVIQGISYDGRSGSTMKFFEVKK